jgi:hypothetical protein
MENTKKKKTTTAYGGRGSGKYSYGNGGFGGQPTVTFEKISQEKWDSIFKKGYVEKELPST